jgi:uncharacterized protein (UPF0548 family)
MDWLIRGGAPPRLEAWSCRRDNIGEGRRPGDRSDRFERVVGREDPGPPALEGPFTRVAAAILDYRVFPSWLIEGVLLRRPLEVGDTVGVLCHFMPRLDVFFAARVVERIAVRHGPVWATGFTYRTLEGHPECGEETFVVEKDELSGAITAALRSWSRPGLWYTRVGGPFTRWYQVRANTAALDNLEETARTVPG